MSFCFRCEKEVDPVHEMGPNGKILPCCPGCSAPMEAAPVVNESVTGKTIATQAAKLEPAKSLKPSQVSLADDFNLVDAMRSELVKLDEEVAHLRKREAYRNQLRRMLAAAAGTDDELPLN